MSESLDRIKGMKFTEVFDIVQSSVIRYEKDEASPPTELLEKIADCFDVSLRKAG